MGTLSEAVTSILPGGCRHHFSGRERQLLSDRGSLPIVDQG